MTQTAIDALCGMLQNIPQDESESKRKAKILSDFAVKVSEEVLLRAGFQKSDPARGYNLLAMDIDVFVNEAAPPDSFGVLELYNVPSSLTATEDPSLAGVLVFAKERVLEWNDKTNKPNRVMTYEEATRFVVFWLAEKILQICRKNEWDRVKQLPDLFDRLAGFLTASPVYSGAEALQQKLGLSYNPNSLLLTVEDIGRQMSTRLYNALHNAACRGQDPFWPKDGHQGHQALNSNRLGHIVTLHIEDFYGLKDIGRKSRIELVELLGSMGLTLGMTLPPEVEAWYEIQMQSLKK